MSVALTDQHNPALQAKAVLWKQGHCRDFFNEILPRVTWDMAPREFLYDVYCAWWSLHHGDEGRVMRRNDFTGVLEWAGWNGRLGLWTPCQRRGQGVPTRFVQDLELCDEFDLPNWQPSRGFVPKATYLGIGR